MYERKEKEKRQTDRQTERERERERTRDRDRQTETEISFFRVPKPSSTVSVVARTVFTTLFIAALGA